MEESNFKRFWKFLLPMYLYHLFDTHIENYELSRVIFTIIFRTIINYLAFFHYTPPPSTILYYDSTAQLFKSIIATKLGNILQFLLCEVKLKFNRCFLNCFFWKRAANLPSNVNFSTLFWNYYLPLLWTHKSFLTNEFTIILVH